MPVFYPSITLVQHGCCFWSALQVYLLVYLLTLLFTYYVKRVKYIIKLFIPAVLVAQPGMDPVGPRRTSKPFKN